VPAILIDSTNITPSSSTAAPASAEPADSANGGQSFKSTLDKEMRNQVPDDKNDAKTAKVEKKEDKQGEDGVTVVSPSDGSNNLPDLVALQIPLASPIAAQRAVDGVPIAPHVAPDGKAKLQKDLLRPGQDMKNAVRDAGDIGKLQAGQMKAPGTKLAESPAGMVLTSVQKEPAATGKPVEHVQTQKPPIAQIAAEASRNGDQPRVQESIKHDPTSVLAAEIRPVLNQQAAQIQAQQVTMPTSARIDAQVGSNAWNDALGQQVVMMVTEKQQQAEIHLNPQDMGPIKVTVTLDNNQASLSFMVREGATRDAIQSALPRLNEMMAESGISLGQTNVQADTSGSFGQSAQPGAPGSRIPNQIEPDNAIAISQAAVRTITRHGLVDTFA
jgi:flagellar hook-length control protein FliK